MQFMSVAPSGTLEPPHELPRCINASQHISKNDKIYPHTQILYSQKPLTSRVTENILVERVTIFTRTGAGLRPVAPTLIIYY